MVRTHSVNKRLVSEYTENSLRKGKTTTKKCTKEINRHVVEEYKWIFNKCIKSSFHAEVGEMQTHQICSNSTNKHLEKSKFCWAYEAMAYPLPMGIYMCAVTLASQSEAKGVQILHASQSSCMHAQERHLYTHPAGPHHYIFSHMFLKGKPANSANALLGRKDKCIWAYSHDARAGISGKKCMNYKHPYEHGKSETHSWIKKRKSTLQRRHNIMM